MARVEVIGLKRLFVSFRGVDAGDSKKEESPGYTSTVIAGSRSHNAGVVFVVLQLWGVLDTWLNETEVFHSKFVSAWGRRRG